MISEKVTTPKLVVKDLNFYYGTDRALKNINLTIPEKMVTAFIGPSGCGKSTLLRTFNRMYELYPKQKATGEILLDGDNLLDKRQDLNTLRAARAGILTGVMLAIARISGETAPLLFTSLNNQFWSSDMNQPMANLPVVIFQFAMSPYTDWQQLAWAGALLITFSVLTLNILARVLFRQQSSSH